LDPKEIEKVTATAEFTLGLLLSLVRKISFITPGRSNDRDAYRGMQLSGKKIGVFGGRGRLGKKMIEYSKALGMKTISYDTNSKPEIKREILGTCDIITIHLPLNKTTTDFISFVDFDLMMEKQSYLINTSRPQIVNKQALINALDLEQIRGAAMDFFDYECKNKLDPELKPYIKKNLLMTPHLGGNTYESINYTAKVVLDKLLVHLSKEGSK